MKTKKTFTKKDCLTGLICAVFALMCMGAIGGGSRKHAKEIVCRSHLRQWYLAMCEFTDDNDGNFWAGWNGAAITQTEWWIAALRDYHGDIDRIRCCPTAIDLEYDIVDGAEVPGPGYDKQPFRTWGKSLWLASITGHIEWGSYGLNAWIEDTNLDYFEQSYWWRNISNITTPDTVPFLLDGQWVDAWPEPWHAPPPAEDTYWGATSHFVRILQNRHNEAESCAFMDGTIRRVGLKELWTLKWHRQYDTEGPWTLAGGVPPTAWPEWMQDMQDY